MSLTTILCAWLAFNVAVALLLTLKPLPPRREKTPSTMPAHGWPLHPHADRRPKPFS